MSRRRQVHGTTDGAYSQDYDEDVAKLPSLQLFPPLKLAKPNLRFPGLVVSKNDSGKSITIWSPYVIRSGGCIVADDPTAWEQRNIGEWIVFCVKDGSSNNGMPEGYDHIIHSMESPFPTELRIVIRVAVRICLPPEYVKEFHKGLCFHIKDKVKCWSPEVNAVFICMKDIKEARLVKDTLYSCSAMWSLTPLDFGDGYPVHWELDTGAKCVIARDQKPLESPPWIEYVPRWKQLQLKDNYKRMQLASRLSAAGSTSTMNRESRLESGDWRQKTVRIPPSPSVSSLESSVFDRSPSPFPRPKTKLHRHTVHRHEHKHRSDSKKKPCHGHSGCGHHHHHREGQHHHHHHRKEKMASRAYKEEDIERRMEQLIIDESSRRRGSNNVDVPSTTRPIDDLEDGVVKKTVMDNGAVLVHELLHGCTYFHLEPPPQEALDADVDQFIRCEPAGLGGDGGYGSQQVNQVSSLLCPPPPGFTLPHISSVLQPVEPIPVPGTNDEYMVKVKWNGSQFIAIPNTLQPISQTGANGSQNTGQSEQCGPGQGTGQGPTPYSTQPTGYYTGYSAGPTGVPTGGYTGPTVPSLGNEQQAALQNPVYQEGPSTNAVQRIRSDDSGFGSFRRPRPNTVPSAGNAAYSTLAYPDQPPYSSLATAGTPSSDGYTASCSSSSSCCDCSSCYASDDEESYSTDCTLTECQGCEDETTSYCDTSMMSSSTVSSMKRPWQWEDDERVKRRRDNCEECAKITVARPSKRGMFNPRVKKYGTDKIVEQEKPVCETTTNIQRQPPTTASYRQPLNSQFPRHSQQPIRMSGWTESVPPIPHPPRLPQRWNTRQYVAAAASPQVPMRRPYINAVRQLQPLNTVTRHMNPVPPQGSINTVLHPMNSAPHQSMNTVPHQMNSASAHYQSMNTVPHPMNSAPHQSMNTVPLPMNSAPHQSMNTVPHPMNYAPHQSMNTVTHPMAPHQSINTVPHPMNSTHHQSINSPRPIVNLRFVDNSPVAKETVQKQTHSTQQFAFDKNCPDPGLPSVYHGLPTELCEPRPGPSEFMRQREEKNTGGAEGSISNKSDVSFPERDIVPKKVKKVGRGNYAFATPEEVKHAGKEASTVHSNPLDDSDDDGWSDMQKKVPEPSVPVTTEEDDGWSDMPRNERVQTTRVEGERVGEETSAEIAKAWGRPQVVRYRTGIEPKQFQKLLPWVRRRSKSTSRARTPISRERMENEEAADEREEERVPPVEGAEKSDEVERVESVEGTEKSDESNERVHVEEGAEKTEEKSPTSPESSESGATCVEEKSTTSDAKIEDACSSGVSEEVPMKTDIPKRFFNPRKASKNFESTATIPSSNVNESSTTESKSKSTWPPRHNEVPAYCWGMKLPPRSAEYTARPQGGYRSQQQEGYGSQQQGGYCSQQPGEYRTPQPQPTTFTSQQTTNDRWQRQREGQGESARQADSRFTPADNRQKNYSSSAQQSRVPPTRPRPQGYRTPSCGVPGMRFVRTDHSLTQITTGSHGEGTQIRGVEQKPDGKVQAFNVTMFKDPSGGIVTSKVWKETDGERITEGFILDRNGQRWEMQKERVCEEERVQTCTIEEIEEEKETQTCTIEEIERQTEETERVCEEERVQTSTIGEEETQRNGESRWEPQETPIFGDVTPPRTVTPLRTVTPPVTVTSTIPREYRENEEEEKCEEKIDKQTSGKKRMHEVRYVNPAMTVGHSPSPGKKLYSDVVSHKHVLLTIQEQQKNEMMDRNRFFNQ